MEISSPLCITSRLLPGCRIGEAEVSIEYAGATPDSRQRYHWHIDLSNGGGEFEGDKLCSGVGEGSLQEGLESLLCFLGAFASACNTKNWKRKDFENAQLFPPDLAKWATAHADEIAMMKTELEEHPDKLIVE